jgi:O-antigen ligase
LLGTGYLTYRYALEKHRVHVPSYGASGETWFVHNDYLQLLQETGPIGLLALLGITLYPLGVAYRRLPGLSRDERPPVVGIAGALAAMSVHGLVDFPFYVPYCLLLYGALLGALDRRLGEIAPSPPLGARPSLIFRAGRVAVITVAAVIFMRPVAAEAAAEWGLRKSVAGEQQAAAFWLGAAQRVESRDWRYHWYAGQFWIAQAAQSGNREAARLAAEAFAAGFEANPLEVRNLLGKVTVHRHYRQLLDDPADAATIKGWLAQAADLAPMNADVRRELAR